MRSRYNVGRVLVPNDPPASSAAMRATVPGCSGAS